MGAVGTPGEAGTASGASADAAAEPLVCPGRQAPCKRPGRRVTHKVVFGEAQQIEALLAASASSITINTSFVERDNLSWREHNRRLARKTIAFSKELPWLEKQLWLSMAYYHFCLPYHSLRQRLPEAEPTRGSGSPRRWQPITPAMAAGMTDHVWTTAELLGHRVPATFLDKLAALEHLFPNLDSVHHVN
jgi:hypothetical protein